MVTMFLQLRFEYSFRVQSPTILYLKSILNILSLSTYLTQNDAQNAFYLDMFKCHAELLLQKFAVHTAAEDILEMDFVKTNHFACSVKDNTILKINDVQFIFMP